MIAKTRWKELYHWSMVAFGSLGIVLNILYHGDFVRSISYFTVQSNLFVVVTILALLVAKNRNQERFQIVKMAVTIAILVTFLVYHLILYPAIGSSDAYDYPFAIDLLVHTLTPIMMVLDYFLFDRKGLLRTRHLGYYLIIPLFYFLYAQVYALAGGTFAFNDETTRYAYGFLNSDLIGWPMVILYSFCLVIIILFIGRLFIYFDQRLSHQRRERSI